MWIKHFKLYTPLYWRLAKWYWRWFHLWSSFSFSQYTTSYFKYHGPVCSPSQKPQKLAGLIQSAKYWTKTAHSRQEPRSHSEHSEHHSETWWCRSLVGNGPSMEGRALSRLSCEHLENRICERMQNRKTLKPNKCMPVRFCIWKYTQLFVLAELYGQVPGTLYLILGSRWWQGAVVGTLDYEWRHQCPLPDFTAN